MSKQAQAPAAEELVFTRPASMADRATHYCPGCHVPVVPERLLIKPDSLDRRRTIPRPEWHCNKCGRTFAPDYFDSVP